MSTSSQLITPTASQISADSTRLFYVDNLRWALIMLVVSMHAAVTYSGLGSWYYTEGQNLDLGTKLVFATYQTFLQAFFMGLLFFLAGYFVPSAFDRKGALLFLRDRLFRLGLPTLLYALAIQPSIEYYILGNWRTGGRSFTQAWSAYILKGHFLSGTGPLWFCGALLVFSLSYAGFRLLRWAPGSPANMPQLTNARVSSFIGLMALATFLVRTVQPMGTSFYNMQLCYFSQYLLLFCAGVAAYRFKWLSGFSNQFGNRWLAWALAGGGVAWVSLLAFGGALQGKFHLYEGGWHWQSAGLSAWESLVCVGVSLGLLSVFRERFTQQSRWAEFFSRNAFCVYVIHAPILIWLSLLIKDLACPPLAKFGLLTLLSLIASFALSAAVFRRIPVLRRIL